VLNNTLSPTFWSPFLILDFLLDTKNIRKPIKEKIDTIMIKNRIRPVLSIKLPDRPIESRACYLIPNSFSVIHPTGTILKLAKSRTKVNINLAFAAKPIWKKGK
jgi:hypothetical protein